MKSETKTDKKTNEPKNEQISIMFNYELTENKIYAFSCNSEQNEDNPYFTHAEDLNLILNNIFENDSNRMLNYSTIYQNNFPKKERKIISEIVNDYIINNNNNNNNI